MGDHFVLLVDRLLTESTLEAALETEKDRENIKFSREKDEILRSSPSKLAECRICHDDDEDLNLETPCSCRGSLKYAHRKCVQRWCNEKGDTICEICHQPFKSGYTAPPPLIHYNGVPTNFRGHWEISRRDLHNPSFIAVVTSDHEYMDPDFDEYTVPSPRSLMCCRIVAVLFMVLLVLRHTLPILLSGAGEYSMTLFTLVMLRTIGVLLPIYVMVRAYTAIQRRHHSQAPELPVASSDQERELAYPRPRLVQIQ